MPVPLVRVICDTSFLIHLVNRRIRNMDVLGAEIGTIQFVVPTCVLAELSKLAGDPQRSGKMTPVIRHARQMDPVDIGDGFVDDIILNHVRDCGRGLVATMDKRLKQRIKAAGGSVLSFSHDHIVLEP